MPAADQQKGYFALAGSTFREGKDPGNALLLANKALDISFHPTIALLRVEILLDQDMLNLAEVELGRIDDWLARMTRENQAQYHWLTAQIQLARLQAGAEPARAKARDALERYLALDLPEQAEHAAAAREQLQSLR